ncbi:ankyrin repeat-containing domain protein [Dactylonectria macrodidyma]|uniref:Ankyrin repeat-containing domain protein n=1 Tax=Dactylonectria macrodidyma TaxID=307937 RepID=A0A9P9D833_9HYPO|nr:ankyrin repeat-containing domain protein [Dactylonectria macrodidyma]
MLLLDLPNELLLHLAESLELERDISALARTNGRLHNLLSGYLYENNVKHHGSSALIWAAYHGRIGTAQRLLDKGADVNVQVCPAIGYTRYPTRCPNLSYESAQTTYEGRTPLLWAAEKGHEALVKLLLQNGVDVNVMDQNEQTALQLAVDAGHREVARMLVANGADMNASDNADWPAVGLGHQWREELVEVRISAGLGRPSPPPPTHSKCMVM